MYYSIHILFSHCRYRDKIYLNYVTYTRLPGKWQSLGWDLLHHAGHTQRVCIGCLFIIKYQIFFLAATLITKTWAASSFLLYSVEHNGNKERKPYEHLSLTNKKKQKKNKKQWSEWRSHSIVATHPSYPRHGPIFITRVLLYEVPHKSNWGFIRSPFIS